MRRDRRVIDPLAVCVSDNVWRNLADLLQLAGVDSADRRRRRFASAPRSSLGVEHRGLGGLGRAEVEHRRQHQKGQAAGAGVDGQRQPGRSRERKGGSRGQQADQCRHQDQTSEHVFDPHRRRMQSGCWSPVARLRPPLGESTSLFPVSRVEQRGGSARERGLTCACIVSERVQPEEDRGLWCGEKFFKILKRKGIVVRMKDAARRSEAGFRSDGRGRRAVAAVWHKSGGREVPCTPELTDVCLSFVMPEQQAARAHACEDLR